MYTWKATKYVASTTADISVATGVHTWNATKYVAEKTADVSVATGDYTWKATKYIACKTADVSVGAYKYMFPSINVSLDNYHTEVRINEMQWGDKKFYIPNYKLKCKDIIRAP